MEVGRRGLLLRDAEFACNLCKDRVGHVVAGVAEPLDLWKRE